MPGVVKKIQCEAGDSVDEGTVVVILEAMKMQNPLHSPMTGTVREGGKMEEIEGGRERGGEGDREGGREEGGREGEGEDVTLFQGQVVLFHS